MASNSPKLSLAHGWSLGENGWNIGLDNNIKKIDGLIQLSVESASVASPPTSPLNGSLFIIPSNASGIWSSNTGKIAHYYNSTWNIYSPGEGWQAWIKDTDIRVNFDGNSWADALLTVKSNISSMQNTISAQANSINDLTNALQTLTARVQALENKSST